MVRPTLLALALGLPLAAMADPTPANLRCEYLTNPLGLGETKPRLSWIVESSSRGDAQSAYQVLVASSPELLRGGKGDLWDSGKVASDRTYGIEYGGAPLSSRERVWWTVQVWGGGEKPRTGKPAWWEMGLLNPSDWQAQWIGLTPPKELEGDVSWIWTDEGDLKNGAPKGERYFRTGFEVTGDVASATLGLAADNKADLMVNGKPLVHSDDWPQYAKADLTPLLKAGKNEISVTAYNEDKQAGLAVLGEIVYKDGRKQILTTSGSWEGSTDNKAWKSAAAWAKMGDQPYGKLRWDGDLQPVPYVRKGFEVARPIKRARVYATARGVYKLSVDGAVVGKGLFNPGWTDYNKRIQYQTYDVTSLLRSGKHTLGMMLGDGWYSGHVGWNGFHSYGDHPQGLAQLEIEYADGTTERVATDNSWQGATGPILSADLLWGETYDARKEIGMDTTWGAVAAESVGTVPLVAQHSPEVEQYTTIKPKSLKEPKPGVFIYDLGQNMVGWAKLRVRGKVGQKVQLRFAEVLNPDGTIYTANLRSARATDTYTLKGGGTEVHEPSFTFHGFRYVEMTGDVRGTIEGVVATSATPDAGTFACSNPLVNQLYHNIRWGQRGNYFDVPTDCPQRDERLGWMADAQVFARTATGNADVSAFLTKWADDVQDAQSPEGGFSDVSPRLVDLNNGAPGWGDAGVIVPWTVYQVYGDSRVLERHYESMKAWIGYIEAENPDGLWTNRRNNDFGDWLNVQTEPPHELLATAYYAHSTDIVAQTARLLGKTEEAARYEALFERIKAAFNAKWVTADGHIADETQTAYLLALQFNLLPEEKREAAAKYLVANIESRDNHLSTGFLGVSYLNPALTSIGRTDVAYKLLLNDTYPSWGYSIRQGATTIWSGGTATRRRKGSKTPA